MVDSIFINISNGIYDKVNAVIDVSLKKCFINDKSYAYNDEALNDILKLVSTWEYEYGSSNVIDGEEFYITVCSNNTEKNYHGKGIFPSNYDYLMDIIGKITNE